MSCVKSTVTQVKNTTALIGQILLFGFDSVDCSMFFGCVFVVLIHAAAIGHRRLMPCLHVYLRKMSFRNRKCYAVL